MNKEYLMIDQVAEQLGVHPKTVRRYISSGRLTAKKIAGSWRITPEALSAFFDACGNRDPLPQQQNESTMYQILNNEAFDSSEKVQACTIVNYRVSDEETTKSMLKEVMEVVAEDSLAHKKSQFSFEYDEANHRMSLIFRGSPSYIYSVMGIVKKFE